MNQKCTELCFLNKASVSVRLGCKMNLILIFAKSPRNPSKLDRQKPRFYWQEKSGKNALNLNANPS